jgi:hypothetical protein
MAHGMLEVCPPCNYSSILCVFITTNCINFADPTKLHTASTLVLCTIVLITAPSVSSSAGASTTVLHKPELTYAHDCAYREESYNCGDIGPLTPCSTRICSWCLLCCECNVSITSTVLFCLSHTSRTHTRKFLKIYCGASWCGQVKLSSFM